ncbi:kanadaptin-like [Prorops nasuta]|uniref:kanadaptin-like n=1 Tax=Prorops nasuta TaxID=863751 RepID=UPI0034CF68AE
METDLSELSETIKHVKDVDKLKEIGKNNRMTEIFEDLSVQQDTLKTNTEEDESVESFKKPILLIGSKSGKRHKFRIISDKPTIEIQSKVEEEKNKTELNVDREEEVQDQELKLSELNYIQPEQINTSSSKDLPLPYKEPSWSGIPEDEYQIEILKSGVILETIDLSKKSYYVIGRLPSCNIPLAHPTISRYHAILQYRSVPNENNKKGFYLYDLGSTHGTFWNGHRIRPNMYVKLHGGHMFKFGCSQRKFILQAPDDDQEEESELSVTELKEQRRSELEERERLEKEYKLQKEEEERLNKEKEENEGIDWGLGEDADEEGDLTENPFAIANDEELFLDDPKKTLRGWFEREGYDLQYQTEERGFGQFLCWVDLPIDTASGSTVRAEALVKGKKKESVIQCALEACRILDRHGLLRQATHEARKRKSKNWEEADFYDSDEDEFLDRTGTIAKKREKRKRLAGKSENQVETHSSLVEKLDIVTKKIVELEYNLKASEKLNKMDMTNDDEDALDAFMSNLNSTALSKDDKIKIKLELQGLKREEERLVKLVNISRPANLPPLTQMQVIDDKNINKNPLPCITQRKQNRLLSDKNDHSHEVEAKIDLKKNECNSEKEEEEEDEGSKDEKIENVKSLASQINTNDLKTVKDKITIDKSLKNEEMSQTENSKNKSTDATETNDLNQKDKASKDDVITNNTKDVKTKKKNLSKKDKVCKEMSKSYDQTTYSENYSMWIPPQNQSGDGKTSLNEKFGY